MLFSLVGCGSSGKKEFESITKGIENSDPVKVDISVEGEVIEIDSDGDDINQIIIAINGNEDYLFEVPEYSLSNNNYGARDSEGKYITQLPTLEIGDNVKVEAGEIQYLVPDDSDERNKPYIIGHKRLTVAKIK